MVYNLPNNFVFKFDPSTFFLGTSRISDYFYDYFSEIEVKTYVYENEYIDKDYLIDYSKFYSRSFFDHSRKTERYHFFANEFNQDNFVNAINSRNKNFFKTLQKNYCGFVIIKPIKDRVGHKLIGRTLVKTYPEKDEEEKRFFLKNKYNLSLFGMPLSIESLPFQQKDEAVGLCATITCWSALFPLMKLFGVQILSPVEITERFTEFPDDSRTFPSEGLNLQQMKLHFSSQGLETEFVDPKFKFVSFTSKDDVVADLIRAYNRMGLPIIATLDVYKKNVKTDYHAVLITGYRHHNGEIKEIYIHDDNIGPYHRIKKFKRRKFNSFFTQWIEKNLDGIEEKYVIERLLVPMYPKIRLCFIAIYGVFLTYKRSTESQIESGFFPRTTQIELFLTDVHEYKKFLMQQKYPLDKKEILITPMPRFLWVFRIHNKNKPIIDYYFDATSVYPKDTKSVRFDGN